MPTLTALVHEQLATIVGPGDHVVDATAGNGHDTAWLAELVGPTGRVYAIDIQVEAIAQTAARLSAEERSRVVLLTGDHAKWDRLIPHASHGRLAAVVFNLGYLPGGDKTRITNTASTLAALEQAVHGLRAGGVLSVLGYPGHPGGAAECNAVAAWFRSRSDLEVTEPDPSLPPHAPRWFWAQKLSGEG
jgi:predicted methyltransferase